MEPGPRPGSALRKKRRALVPMACPPSREKQRIRRASNVSSENALNRRVEGERPIQPHLPLWNSHRRIGGKGNQSVVMRSRLPRVGDTGHSSMPLLAECLLSLAPLKEEEEGGTEDGMKKTRCPPMYRSRGCVVGRRSNLGRRGVVVASAALRRIQTHRAPPEMTYLPHLARRLTGLMLASAGGQDLVEWNT